jgi:hypothetical protein
MTYLVDPKLAGVFKTVISNILKPDQKQSLPSLTQFEAESKT